MVILLGLSLGLVGGWWIWGRPADVPNHVIALLEDYCLPAVTREDTNVLDDSWIDGAIGARVSMHKLNAELDPAGIACSVMEFDQRWNDAQKKALADLLASWAYANLEPLNDGALVSVEMDGEEAVPPSFMWRRYEAGPSYFLYIFTNEQGRISLVTTGRATFPDTAEKTGRITDV